MIASSVPVRSEATLSRRTCIELQLTALALIHLHGGAAYAATVPYFMPSHRSMTAPASHRPVRLGVSPGTEHLAEGFSYLIKGMSPATRPQWTPTDLSTLSKIGQIKIERTTRSPLLEESGVTTTFAYPIKGLPGVDLVANVFGGHRNTIQGAAGGSATITSGIRIRW